MEIVSKLKYSHKGQLNYERNTNFVHLYKDLQRCASPPLRKFNNLYHSGSTYEKNFKNTDGSKNNSKLLVIRKESECGSKGLHTMSALSRKYLQNQVAISEYEGFWDNKVKLAVKKKMQEFCENEKILLQKTKLALQDLCKREAVRENYRHKELQNRYEEHQNEKVKIEKKKNRHSTFTVNRTLERYYIQK